MRLTPRQRLYIESLVYLGYKEAKRISGYSRAQLTKIGLSEACEAYRMEVIKDYQSNYDAHMGQYEALLKDKKASPTLKEKVLRQLIEWERGKARPHPEQPGKRPLRLPPTKETWDVDKADAISAANDVGDSISNNNGSEESGTPAKPPTHPAETS